MTIIALSKRLEIYLFIYLFIISFFIIIFLRWMIILADELTIFAILRKAHLPRTSEQAHLTPLNEGKTSETCCNQLTILIDHVKLTIIVRL